MINTIYWIRHGESVANTYKYLHSMILDPILKPNGQDQIICASKSILDCNIQLILCSPLIRSIESGKIIKNYLQSHCDNQPLDFIIDSTILEGGLGLDNMPINNIICYSKNIGQVIPFISQYGRFRKNLNKYCRKYTNIAIVGHQKTNSEFIKKMTNQTILPMKNGEIVKMTLYDGKVTCLENYLRKCE